MHKNYRELSSSLVRLLISVLLVTGFFINKAFCTEPEKKESPQTKGFWGINFTAPETKDKKGIVLTYIYPEGPADRAGLKVKDLILEINGKEIINEDSFRIWVDKSKSGQELKLTVMRNEEITNMVITLGDRSIEMQPRNHKRHFINMQSLGTYIVMLPEDYEESKKEYPLCVILHGRGSTELGHGKLADQLGREGVIYIAPRYSYPFVDIFIENQQEGWSGYPPYEFGEDNSYYPIIENLSVDWIFACISDAKKHYRVAKDKVYIFGHSQGAFFSIACAALHPELVESYFAYAPYVPDSYISKEILNGLKKHKVKVYLAHGTEDKVIDVEQSKKAEKVMRESGVNVTFKMFKTDHSFAQEIISFAKEWLSTEVLKD